MPINQFNVTPVGFSNNRETKSTKKNNNTYNGYYYMSPEYDRLSGGVGASNSSYGLRATTNADGLSAYNELYERTLGELISTLVGNSDTTRINKYIAPTVNNNSQTSVTNTTPKTVTSVPKTATSTVKKSSTTSRINKPMVTGGGGSANTGNMSFNTSGITKSRQPLIVGLINALMGNTPTSTTKKKTIGNKNKGSSRRISHR